MVHDDLGTRELAQALKAKIKAEAEEMAEKFMEARQTGVNATRPSDEKWSDLRLRVMQGDNSLTLVWEKKWWLAGKRGTGKRWLLRHIKKGRGTFSYNKKILKKYARPWEWREVWATECRCAVLRELWSVTQHITRLEKTWRETGEAYTDALAGFAPSPPHPETQYSQAGGRRSRDRTIRFPHSPRNIALNSIIPSSARAMGAGASPCSTQATAMHRALSHA